MATPTPPTVTQIGKQPIIDYVTKDYNGFKQGMLALIPLLLPSWTDRSENDFGVVLIELFSYAADILSYYQDRVANEAYLSTATQRRSIIQLLRLIGYQVDPGLSASAWLHIDLNADLNLTAAQLPYRVKAAGAPGQPDVIFELTQPASLLAINSAIKMTAAVPAGTTALTLPHAQHALNRGDTIYFEETTAGPGGQPQIRRSVPLQIIAVQAVDANNDAITWLPPLDGPYVTPASTVLKGNNVTVSNGQTIPDQPTYVGDGTPDQSFRLTRTPVSYLLSAPSGGSTAPSGPELQVRVDGQLWDLVDSFFESGPFDTHYTVSIDENDYLTVQFGTGQQGAVPTAGVEVNAVYRIGLGQAGNVGPDAINVAVTNLAQVKAVSNPYGATGGAERESDDEAKISGPGSVIAQGRAVTLEDFILLSDAFPGVGKATARVGLRGGYKVVQVYVVPEDTGIIPPPPPAAALKTALKSYLEARMPVNRMAGVDVLDPTYVAVDIAVDVHVQATASASQVQAAALAALEQMLAYANVDFGASIRVGDIYANLYPLPGIAYTQLRRLAREDRLSPATGTGCDVMDLALGEEELPYRGQITVFTIGGGP